MFENLISSERSDQSESLINQVVKILAIKNSNAATLQFISQIQTGIVLDAVFVGNTPQGKGIISFKGNKVIVELPKVVLTERQQKTEQPARSPLDNGQAIRVRVEKLGPKLALKIISPELHQDRPYNPDTRTSLTSRGKSFSRLTRFEIFSQTSDSSPKLTSVPITHILDSKTIVVDTGNRSFVVPVENVESLKTGTKVNISIEKVEKGQSITLVDVSSSSNKKIDFNTLKPYLPARMPLVQMANLITDEVLNSSVMTELKVSPDVVAQFEDTLRLFIPNEGKLPSQVQIRQQVESSGINYEARVRKSIESGLPIHKEIASDLKGLLLKLDQSADKAAPSVKTLSPFTEFRQTIKFAIDNIELNQLSSQFAKQENQPLMIQIPNPLISGNKTIHLYLRRDSTEGEGGDSDKKLGHNVAFILDLSFLGKIKINAQISPERLSVKIDTESKGIAKYINDRAKDFKQKMKEHNIETSVECCVTDKLRTENDSLVELLVSQNKSLINIKT